MQQDYHILPPFYWEKLIKTALEEDLGLGGDITTSVLELQNTLFKGDFVARQDGILCGIEAIYQTFSLLDPQSEISLHKRDGDHLKKGDKIASITGKAGALLTGERTALNLLCQLSGIATTTHQIVSSLKGTSTKVAATRKTQPGLRAFQKYAVQIGGGTSHRFRLDDAILIKDNHIALYQNDIKRVIETARKHAGHITKIEIEIDTIEQLQQALQTQGADIYLLDNMSPNELQRAVAMIDGKALTEASGGITPENAREIAQIGVDVISLGWLTQHISPLDIGLDSTLPS